MYELFVLEQEFNYTQESSGSTPRTKVTLMIPCHRRNKHVFLLRLYLLLSGHVGPINTVLEERSFCVWNTLRGSCFTSQHAYSTAHQILTYEVLLFLFL